MLRNPVMIPYTCGLRTLNKIYLDTTHVKQSKEESGFPSEADGMRHLIEQVAAFPEETIFHVNNWTLGYEKALASLAAAFSSKVASYLFP